MSSTPRLSARQLCFSHADGTEQFKNITFSLTSGTLAIVGPNGVGKSTLLRLLSGEHTPTSGQVSRFGELVCISQAVDSELSLSPGERQRKRLSKLLHGTQDIVLLDEPTNHLDADGKRMLAHFVQSTHCVVVAASHDRDFLSLFDHFLELREDGTSHFFTGTFEAFQIHREGEKQAAQLHLQAARENFKDVSIQRHNTLERQKKRMAAGKKGRENSGLPKILLGKRKRNAENTTAGLLKKHDKLLESATEDLEVRKKAAPAQLKLKIDVQSRTTHQPVLVSAHDVNFEIVQKCLWKIALNFQINRGDRIALKGKNGSGKTTLLNLLSRRQEASGGEVQFRNIRTFYLDQEFSLLQPELSLLENMVLNFPDKAKSDLRIVLGRLSFYKEDVHKLVNMLSGGEKLKASLALALVENQAPDLMILDEPTNNLDLDSVAVLERVLRDHQGSLICVSHDETFLKSIEINREFLLTENGLESV